MNDSYGYTIVFMLVLSAVFTTVLAVTQGAYLPVISENERNVERKAILKVLNIEPGPSASSVFEERVVPAAVGDWDAYLAYDDGGHPLGYAFPLNGQGLWGSIRGFIGISPGFDRLLGLEFVEQNETPGLGGRIDEAWFKNQFQGLELRAGEDIAYGSGLDAITGATSSSQAVLSLLNAAIAELLPLKEVVGS
ncbi:MAG: FMN-binding protein [Firmicutes bacterium]|nr:FMN-binding protein [Bacillota bacterium]